MLGGLNRARVVAGAQRVLPWGLMGRPPTVRTALSSEDPLGVVILHLCHCRLHPYRLRQDVARLLGALQDQAHHRRPHHHHHQRRHLSPVLVLVAVRLVVVYLVQYPGNLGVPVYRPWRSCPSGGDS